MFSISQERFEKECKNLSQTRKVSGPFGNGSKIRMGQFFANKFPELNTLESSLFYEPDDNKSAAIIKKFVV